MEPSSLVDACPKMSAYSTPVPVPKQLADAQSFMILCNKSIFDACPKMSAYSTPVSVPKQLTYAQSFMILCNKSIFVIVCSHICSSLKREILIFQKTLENSNPWVSNQFLWGCLCMNSVESVRFKWLHYKKLFFLSFCTGLIC